MDALKMPKRLPSDPTRFAAAILSNETLPHFAGEPPVDHEKREHPEAQTQAEEQRRERLAGAHAEPGGVGATAASAPTAARQHANSSPSTEQLAHSSHAHPSACPSQQPLGQPALEPGPAARAPQCGQPTAHARERDHRQSAAAGELERQRPNPPVGQQWLQFAPSS